MARFSESDSGSSHFLFFYDYEEEEFEGFVNVVLRALNVKEDARDAAPYTVLVSVFYEGHKLILTCGSFEGCFIAMEKDAAFLSGKIIEAFERLD